MQGGLNFNDCGSLPSCSSAPNQCNDQQKSGYDFTNANIPEGSCSGFGGMSFQGLSYGTFGGQSKRDLFPRGGSQGSNVSSSLLIMDRI